MQELFLALEQGKTIKWFSQFPRYYKADGEYTIYSDDLVQWNTSTMELKTLALIIHLNHKDFEVYEG